MAPRAPDVSFVEAMRGDVTTHTGVLSSIDIEVVAEAKTLRDFRKTGWVELRGLLRAPFWIDETPTRGSVRITARALVYQLRFQDRRGTVFSLEGVKHPSLLAPLRSMTNMVAEVRDAEARVVARGTMRFDLADIVPFVLSWVPGLPSAGAARHALDARRLESERHWIETGRAGLRESILERARGTS